MAANVFSHNFVGRGGDDQAKLRNSVINDERPFVWNERKTYFTTGWNRGAEKRQAKERKTAVTKTNFNNKTIKTIISWKVNNAKNVLENIKCFWKNCKSDYFM